ncbi:unnamed protein product [Caenorhabditis angaria]|uniref:RING-type domain-containing protein n=1 Tax=Caenorhabditis angaria TaxID=860376 RepID=A0A9P1IM80_9PELO|nr:unnamed protein product [Caenorhabditis angaria]
MKTLLLISSIAYQKEYPNFKGTKKGINSKVIAEISNDFLLKHCSENSRILKNAGIKIFWCSKNGQTHLDFFLCPEYVVTDIFDFEELADSCKNAQVLNKLFAEVLSGKTKTLLKKFWNFRNSLTKNNNDFRQFFDALEKSTGNWQVPLEFDNKFEISENLLQCKLMQYQKKTVKWMMAREKMAENLEYFEEFFQCFSIQDDIFYYPAMGIFSSKKISKFPVDLIPKGGILADEMGLGKTIEMLALIVSNPKFPNSNNNTIDESKVVGQLDWDEYKSKKIGRSNGHSPSVFTVIRKQDSENVKTRKCKKCRETCVVERCGWKSKFDSKKFEFLCPLCINDEELMEVKTTLIVIPDSLCVQWYNEIKKHCCQKLQIMFYFGLNKVGYLHPREIEEYDIILTTYGTLKSDFGFVKTGARCSADVKFSPSSINHVKWWRIIADESQLVETSSSSKLSQMSQLLESSNKWCMSGTPIMKDIKGLFGLFKFIDFFPFSIENIWNNCIVPEYFAKSKSPDNSWLIKLGSQLMRRNTKAMVDSEFRLPKLIEIEKLIKFSTIEERQYKEVKDELRRVVENAIGRDSRDNEVLLSAVTGRERIMTALAKLKETLVSCGNHLIKRKRENIFEEVNMDPNNVTFRLIRAKKSQIADSLRVIGYELNISADYYWPSKQYEKIGPIYEQFVKLIKKVQEVNENFERCARLDFEDEAPPAKMRRVEVDDESESESESEEDRINARAEIMELRKTSMKPIKIDIGAMAHFVTNIRELSNISESAKSSIQNIGGVQKFEDKLKTDVENFFATDRMEIQKMKCEFEKINIFDEKLEIQTVFEERVEFYSKSNSKSLVDNIKISTITVRGILEEMPFLPIFVNSTKHFEDSSEFVITDTRFDGRIVKFETHSHRSCFGNCKNYRFLNLVENYETCTNYQLFQKLLDFLNNLEDLGIELFDDFAKLVDRFSNSPIQFINPGGDRMEVISCRHQILDINGKLCHDDTSRKLQKASIGECELCVVYHTLAHFRFLVGVGSFHGELIHENHKKSPVAKFVEHVLGLEKKNCKGFQMANEISQFYQYFNSLRQMAITINQWCKKIEDFSFRLNILKQKTHKLTLESFLGENDQLPDCPQRKHLMRMKRIENASRWVSSYWSKLDTACQELAYLVTLCLEQHQQEESEEDESKMCRVCLTDMEVMAIFPCGHRVCEGCLGELRKRAALPMTVQCVSCRKVYNCVTIMIAQNPSTANSVIPGFTLSAKLESTILLMKEILEEDPENKIIVFTNFEVGSWIWKYVVKIWKKIKLPFTEVSRQMFGNDISNFQSDKDCRILFCSLKMCANGLNLTQANHIIFLEPSHLQSVVKQAIGRISRYGQKKEMKVYHLLIEGSIEMEIRKIAKAKTADNLKSELTVGNLRQIFGVPTNA